MFGEWTRDIQALSNEYTNSKPFEHVVIPNFFRPDVAERIYAQFPHPDDTWFKYDNPFEGKCIFNTFKPEDPMKSVIDSLYTPEFLQYMSSISGIEKLESDPHLNAGGLHAYTRNGMSGVHLDYTIHPITGKERRLSIMVYMSKDWDESWGGNLKMWDENLENDVTLKHSLWNTALIFRTNGKAYHGFPEPIKCPEGAWRKVIGIYYVTDPTKESLENPRRNAHYFAEPGKPVHENMQKLLDIRRSRRLTADDLCIWPDWRRDCGRED
jgi:hypothetical protein